MPQQRTGVSRESIVAAALRIVDDDGPDAVTMTRVAEMLGIRVPSLYHHVDGQQGLFRELRLHVIGELGEVLRDAVLGVSGDDALEAFAEAFRGYVIRHPGRYQISLHEAASDPEVAAAGRRAVAAVQAVIRSYGLTDRQAVHAGRALRAAVHGFVDLETAGSLGGGVPADESFRQMVRLFADGLRHHWRDGA